VCNANGDLCEDPTIAPDLHPMVEYLKPYVEYKYFEKCDCAVGDCLGGFGMRKLLRFSMMVKNNGTADLFIGDPGQHVHGSGFYK
jgi:hypothetical protein